MSDPDHDLQDALDHEFTKVDQLKESNRQLRDLVQELQNNVASAKASVRLLQEERARSMRYASKIKCRLQDINLLLDGSLNDRPIEVTMDKLLFVLNEEDRLNDEANDNNSRD